MRLTVLEIERACKGRIINHAETAGTYITGVSTDSRKDAGGMLFVPLTGPSFDGHAYIEQAATRGAVCALTEQDITAPAGLSLIRVASTHQALLDLAAYYRRLFDVRVVAITGSVGKTTTKDMIAAVLSRRYNTAKTEGNFNNTIGLPLTVFSLNENHEVLVVEMGMNQFGEISTLSRTVQPDIAVITNIGDSHIENLGSREGILRAKLEILDGMDEHGVLVLNGNDPLLSGMTTLRDRVSDIIFCRMAEAPDGVCADRIEPLGINGTRCRMHIGKRYFNVRIPKPGTHMVMNALLAAAVGAAMGLDGDEIAAGIEGFASSQNRMEFIHKNELTVINDVYNANPASMQAAVSVLAGLDTNGGRRVGVLGDMFELGAHSDQMHEQVGRFVAEQGIDVLIAIGQKAAFIQEGYTKTTEKGEVFYFENKASFLRCWRDIFCLGDTVLVKASHGMAFEEIVAEITDNGGSRKGVAYE